MEAECSATLQLLCVIIALQAVMNVRETQSIIALNAQKISTWSMLLRLVLQAVRQDSIRTRQITNATFVTLTATLATQTRQTVSLAIFQFLA